MSDNDKSRKAANEQLMSCPFCGGKARASEHVVPVTRFLDFGRRRITSEFVYGITCQECGAMSSQYFETMGEAVNAWNTRVLVPQEISAREYEKAIKTIVAAHDLSTLRAWQRACEDKDWEKAVEIIEEWTKEHSEEGSEKTNTECPKKRRKTYAEDFFEKFPKAWKRDGIPCTCRNEVYKGESCPLGMRARFDPDCAACWNEEMSEK